MSVAHILHLYVIKCVKVIALLTPVAFVFISESQQLSAEMDHKQSVIRVY